MQAKRQGHCRNAGFIIHPVKSVLEPTKRPIYLGFVLDSESMTVKLTDQKVPTLKSDCHKLLRKHDITIHELSQVVGKMVTAIPGTNGKLFYRNCDNHKALALKLAHGNYNAQTRLPNACREDL